MSLINVTRAVLKFSQSFSESILFSPRSIALAVDCHHKKSHYSNTVEETKSPSQGSQAPPPSGEASQNTQSETNPELDKFTSQIKELTEKNAEISDKYQRALAERENLRMRLTKQIDDAKKYGIQSFVKDLLETADVLRRATESVPLEQINDNNVHLKALFEGLVMTEKNLNTTLKRHGVEPVNPLNEKFDPNFHEALFQQKAEGKEPGTIIVVSKIGYKLHDRVVRPALVGVAQ